MEEQWAKVELMGHRTRVGKVSEVEQFGGKLLRLAPIDGDGTELPIELYGASAIFCLTYTTEEVVKAEVERVRKAKEESERRMKEWESRRLPSEATADDTDNDDGTPF